jgi:hypothetical protein
MLIVDGTRIVYYHHDHNLGSGMSAVSDINMLYPSSEIDTNPKPLQ